MIRKSFISAILVLLLCMFNNMVVFASVDENYEFFDQDYVAPNNNNKVFVIDTVKVGCINYPAYDSKAYNNITITITTDENDVYKFKYEFNYENTGDAVYPFKLDTPVKILPGQKFNVSIVGEYD